MKTSRTWNFRSILGRIIMGLVLVAMIGSIDVMTAIGQDHRKGNDNRRDDNDRRGGHDRDRRDNDRDRRGGHDRDGRAYDHSNYRGRGYVAPPVVYLPPPPPGLGIFFPPFHR